MRFAAWRRSIPAPLKSCLKWLLGWVYWARRRLRQLLGGGSLGARAVASPAVVQPRGAAVELPPDAPDCLVASNEHGTYCVPRSSHHRPVAEAILRSRVWEADTLDLVRGVESGADIVHAGTYFGDFIPALARSRTDGAVVWAFEPGAENFRCSEITVELNELENVVLTHAGLGASDGDALLATSDRAGLALGGASRLITDRARARWHANEEVRLVTVDGIVGADRPVAAIQLDVEGHEQEALTGAMRTIERCRPLIVLETLPDEDWLARNLAPLGYEVGESVNRNFLLRCR